jgi:hypothetical protein
LVGVGAQQLVARREEAAVQAAVELEPMERVEREPQTKAMPVAQVHQIQGQMYRQVAVVAVLVM